MQEFEQKWWSYLSSQVCWHSWKINSLLTVSGYYGDCGTGSVLGADGNQKDLLLGFSSVSPSRGLKAGPSQQKC